MGLCCMLPVGLVCSRVVHQLIDRIFSHNQGQCWGSDFRVRVESLIEVALVLVEVLGGVK